MSSIATYSLQDVDYPKRLLSLSRPPLRVWLRGAWNERLPSVAIVGARAASKANEQKATIIAHELSRAGVAIVSGGALGIDAAAHQGALTGEGRTCAILGSGINMVYPQRHIGLFDQILKYKGCLLSCFPPEADIKKWHFPLRNDLIAAFSDAVLLIQSPCTSGSRYTAETAKKLGRPVLVLAGAPEVIDMIAKGAKLIRNTSDILSILRTSSAFKSIVGETNSEAAQGLPDVKQETNFAIPTTFGEAAQKLFMALVQSKSLGQGLTELSISTGLPLKICVSTLCELELEGYCFRIPGERYVATN